MFTIFIDGREGTTGLRINERIGGRSDLQLIILPEEQRKDPKYRAEALNSCDIAFLCLPDAAAREAVELITNPNVRVIDASTAHRCSDQWAYGLPELSAEHRAAIVESKRVSVPGCHASGFAALVYPLRAAGIIKEDAYISAHSITGYSGGGKKMIAQYQQEDRDTLLDSPRQYGLVQQHKHIPEMVYRCGLQNKPVFCPIVCDYYSGMLTTVPLFPALCGGGSPEAVLEKVKEVYAELYQGPVVRYVPYEQFNEEGFAASNAMADKDGMQITVAGDAEHAILMSRFDNLGKGASGAAVQCMNLMLGVDETTGLVV
ncbi:MAG: N-acetyl-gamma-glutamyl-phosphate reductase [Ruminococcaceae bacterium]|nr:N-acetyl-gamma-glutamyl-phosphate reductase [Oscillospiraceae bacterium]